MQLVNLYFNIFTILSYFLGIEYLVENRLLRHDPQDVAHFLYKGEGLNKTAIGKILQINVMEFPRPSGLR